MRLIQILNQPLSKGVSRQLSYTWLFNYMAMYSPVQDYWPAKRLMEDILDEIGSTPGYDVR